MKLIYLPQEQDLGDNDLVVLYHHAKGKKTWEEIFTHFGVAVPMM